MKKSPRYGHIDYIRDGVVHGWAIDSLRGNNAASLFLFVDDRPVANFFCDIDRADLEDAGLRGSQAGFQIPVPEQYWDGEPHSVSIRFHSGEYVLFSDDKGRTAKSAILQMHMPVTMSGHVDGLTHGALRGWGVRQDHGSRVKADKNREDVAKALGCDLHCGFVFRPPTRFRDGQSYTFEFNFADTGDSLEGSPVSFAYPAQLSESRVARLHNVVEDMNMQLWRLRRELKDMTSQHVFTLADYDAWVRQYHAALRYRRRQTPWPANRPQPLVSILCPVYRPRLTDFVAAVESVLAQTYPTGS